MALTTRHNHVLDWIGVDWPDRVWPDRFARLFDLDRTGWLRVEEFHDEGTLVIRVDVPGIDPDNDVEISTADGLLTIKAHREEKSERQSKRGYRSEVRYGSFERTVALPDGASEDNVQARYADGVLEIRIPCAEHSDAEHAPSEPKKIPVRRA